MASLLPFIADHAPIIDPPEVQLKQMIEASGLGSPGEIFLDGQIHRFATSPKPGDEAGWYIAFGDGIPAGRFGCFRQGIDQKWCANIGRELSEVEKMQNAWRFDEARRKRDTEKKLKNDRAAETSYDIWINAPGASDEHPYLKRKGIHAHIARIARDGRLILPLLDEEGEICSLQYISDDGEKKFQQGGAVNGKFCQIGELKKEKIFVVEGYATGATVYEETGVGTIVAYSANQLPNVVGIMRKTYPTSEIVIVADNDKSGTGQNYANQAAAKHGASVVVSPVESDINDYRQQGGDVGAFLEKRSNLSEKMKVIFGNDLPLEYEAPDEIIQDLIVANSLNIIYGDSNSGKTFWALSLATGVAEGIKVYDKQVEKGLVVYLATEAPGSIRSRMQAIKKFHNVFLDNLAVVQAPLNFYSTPGDALDVIHLIDEVSAIKGQKVKMIVADTLARMSAGANENTGEDMGPVMERFALVASTTGAAVVIIHHSGKDVAKGSRGWSGIRAHIDTEIEVIEDGGVRTATITKQRELSSKGQVIAFELTVVEMGISKFGAEVTTCVAVPSDVKAPKKIDKTLEKHIRTIKDIHAFSGMEFIENDPYVTKSAIKRYLTEVEVISEQSAKQSLKESDESRLIGRLLMAGIIQAKDSGYVIVDLETANICRILASENS